MLVKGWVALFGKSGIVEDSTMLGMSGPRRGLRIEPKNKEI